MRGVIVRLNAKAKASMQTLPMKMMVGTAMGVIFMATAVRADEILDRGRVGHLSLGMLPEAIYKIYPKEKTKQVDLSLELGPTPALQVFLGPDRAQPSLILLLDGPDGRISGFDVRDPRFKTANGLRVGSSMGQLRKLYNDLPVGTGEGNIYAVVEKLNMSFELQLDRQTLNRIYTDRHFRGKDTPLIPDTATITSIWVY
jgi:hypothetical protein